MATVGFIGLNYAAFGIKPLNVVGDRDLVIGLANE